jgi:hypothetical protein
MNACEHPYNDGPAHKGHARCIKTRKRGEAKVRQIKSDEWQKLNREEQALEVLRRKSMKGV